MIDMVVNGKFKGLHSCWCHLFESEAELKKEYIKKLVPGTKVQNRCSGKVGEVHEVLETKYYHVKYGKYPRDITLEHVTELIVIDNNKSKIK